MRSNEERGNEAPMGATAALLAAALSGVNVAIVGPRTLHVANAAEYAASYWSVLWLLAAVALLWTAVLTVAQLLLPRRLRDRAIVFVFSLGVLAWLQGNWLVGSYGLLDGRGLDLSAEPIARVRDPLLWLGGIALAQLFHRALRARVVAIAAVFLTLQLVTLPFSAGSPTSERVSLIADDEIFELSSGTNLVLLILDTVTSDTFEQFAAADPELYDATFSGFTFFSDTTGSFPSTQYAVPVMLGAPPYDNRTPVDDYLATSLQRDAITVPLLAAGFRVDWASAWPLFCSEGRYSSCFSIPRPYEAPERQRLQMAAQLLDLSLFRHAPYGLKQAVHRDDRWLVQSLVWREGEEPIFVSSAAAFFADFVDRLGIGRDTPTLKILHTGGGHGPFVLDAECAAVPSGAYNRANYEEQTRCALRQTRALFDRMRELGAWDRSLIVVAGDHGASFGARAQGSHGLTRERLSRSRPLLLVKWPGDAGGLERSNAPASLEDIAPTLAAAAGIEVDLRGRDLARLERGDARRRSYGLYVQRKGTPGGHLERVERYTVGPDARRPEAWDFEGVAFSPSISLAAREIAGDDAEADVHFSYLGWAKPVRDRRGHRFRPATGPVAALFVELPSGTPIEVTAKLRVRSWALPQSIRIEVDGVAVGRFEIDQPEFAEHSFRIPVGIVRERVTAIEFRSANSQPANPRGSVTAFDLAQVRWQAVSE
jgi:hypothetical protein